MKKNYILVLSILIILGLLCFICQSIWLRNYPIWNAVFGNLGCVLLISGTLELLHKVILRHEEEKEMEELFGVSLAIRQSGLKTIMTNSSNYDYTAIISESNDFSVIINDGLRWIGNNSQLLEDRFNKRATNTEFYFVNPNGLFAEALAQKTSVELDFLKSKIEQSISLLESTYNKSQKQGELKIYFLKNYPTQTLFYSERKVIITPYQTSGGRATIPLYEYKYSEGYDSIGNHYKDDLEKVRNESQLISHNGRRLG